MSRVDFSGAHAKIGRLKTTPQAVKFLASRWAAETVQELKRSATSMKKSHAMGRNKTSQLARSVGMEVSSAGGATYVISVGTGLGRTISSKYARIQDEGGVTHPTVTPKMRRWAWAMYHQSFKAAVKGMRLMGRIRRGALETFKGEDNKYKAIALTKKPKLDVRVPASGWFSNVIERREPILHEYLDPEVVCNIASQMVGRGGT